MDTHAKGLMTYLRHGVKGWMLVLAVILSLVAGYGANTLLSGGGHPSAPAETMAEHAEHEEQPQWWTCSTHPQIKLPKPGLCPLCGMQLIPMETQEDEPGGLRELTVSEHARKLMDIETALVERRFVQSEIRMVGKVDFDETRLKYITAWVPGRLDRLYVDYTGVPVKKGDHMVYMYSPELFIAQKELIQAKNAIRKLARSGSGLVRETTEATVEAAREKLRLWGLKPEQIKQIEQRGKASDHMTIYSPTGGIVVHKDAQEGMYVKTGTRIYTIADLSEVWVQLDAYESDLMWLRPGQEVEFTTEAYPGEFFEGRIAFIDPVLNQQLRTVKVRVNAANADMRLKPGMFVRAVAKVEMAAGGKVMDAVLAGKWICPMHPNVVKDAAGKCDICEMPLVRVESLGYVGVKPIEADKPLVIPVSAAMVTGTRAIVYVKLPDTDKPTFEGREVVLGPRAGNYYIVRHGLSEGERVVTRGNFKIDAELQIRAKPSMMTPGGGGGGGGHQHGPAAASEKESAADAASVKLPVLVQAQLYEVLARGDAVAKAVQAGRLGDIRSSFASLGASIKAVQSDALGGHMGMLWKEYAMFLGNDAVEGREAKDLPSAEISASVMAEHLASMKAKLGLTHGKHVASVPQINSTFRRQLGEVIEVIPGSGKEEDPDE